MSQSQCGRTSSQIGLLIVALVGRYPPNWLIRRGSILYPDCSFSLCTMQCWCLRHAVAAVSAVVPCSGGLSRVTHRPPLSSSRKKTSFDLHVLSTPPAFISEPGSNSHVQFSVQFCTNAFLSVCVSYLKDFTVFIGCSFYYAKNFTRLTTFVIRLFKKSSRLVILFNYQGSL